MVREGEVYGNLVFPGGEETTRSYHVTTDDGGEYWRNRRMLLKSAEHEPVADDIHPDETPSTRTQKYTLTLVAGMAGLG